MRALDTLQENVRTWRTRNFGFVDCADSLLGVVEEVGELAHVILKAKQGIRGYDDEVKAARETRDAIGDICIFLFGVCDANGWLLGEIIQETADVVLKRDWKANREDGKDGAKQKAGGALDACEQGVLPFGEVEKGAEGQGVQ